MQQKHVFRIIPEVFGNISKSGNIWDGVFSPYLDGKTDCTSVCAYAVHEFYRPSMVKIATPNIPRFANVIPNIPGMTRKTSFSCIEYRMQLRAKRVLDLGRFFSYSPAPRAQVRLVRKTSSSAECG